MDTLAPHRRPTPPFRRGSASSIRSSSPGSSRQQPYSVQRRGSASSLAVPSRTNSESPDDGYAYGDVGPSPEGSATTERKNSSLTSPIPELQLDGRATSFVHTELEKVVEESKPILYERQAGSRWAKVPDEENPSRVNGTFNQIENAIQPQLVLGQPASRRSRWRFGRLKKADVHDDAVQSNALGKLRHVMLHWAKGDDERLVLNANLPPVADRRTNSQNHVPWQHFEVGDLRFAELEKFVELSKPQGLQESEIGLTKRLLKRVQKKAETPFVGGRFLTPLALRYDILDDSRYSVDRCCIFLSFPYFDVHKAQRPKAFQKGEEVHPMRTLLQSRYRLNDTIERDKTQCVRSLKEKALSSCIEVPSSNFDNATPKDALIHVPQLWTLIMGVDRMITMGPIDDIALQGSSMRIKDDAGVVQMQRNSLVRISFINQGKLEELTYPMKQCSSWFGLLNKHQQIRGILKKDNEKATKANPKDYDPLEYKLQIQGHVIKDRSWPSVQKSGREEVLNLWMRTPKRKVPKVSVKMDGDSDSASGYNDNRLNPTDRTASANVTTSSFLALDHVPIVSPFLEWKIIDEFGEPDICPIEEKLNRFLNAIYRSLPAACSTSDTETDTEESMSDHTNPRLGSKSSARPKIAVKKKSAAEVDSLVRGLALSQGGSQLALEQILLSDVKRLLDLFLPSWENRDHPLIELFWGALSEILIHRSYLEQFIQNVNDIILKAELIHLGVYYEVRDEDPKGAVAECAILLSSMVDALGNVFHMLVEAVRDVRSKRRDPNSPQSLCNSKVVKYCGEATLLLETAKNELISEATGAVSGENVGPVLTPEALLIIFMERLRKGVSGKGNVDVINIFEECLEDLALNVRDRASRRLLQRINAFDEEISIVYDVLLEQRKVLLELCEYLDPLSFKNPSIARKMRYGFERKGIGRALISIRDQLIDCTELRQRAKVLATQNVQLVETLTDDNGRAIFIFTFITVLFLPLTFVAGYFGMNVAGISDTKAKPSHFWSIAIPVTAGIMLLCGIVIFQGEYLWFAMKVMPRNTRALFRKLEKRKLA